MSEMIERVAKAMEDAFEYEGRVFDGGQAKTLARAAIEAMREPTDWMLECAYEATEFNGQMGIEDVEDYRKAHRAMIDAALKEPATEPVS